MPSSAWCFVTVVIPRVLTSSVRIEKLDYDGEEGDWFISAAEGI